MVNSSLFTPGIDLSINAAAVAERAQEYAVLVRTDGAGAGSGIVWLADGAIITNSHVVPHHSAIVEASDGRTSRAEVVRRDPLHDLALLAADRPLTPPAAIRTSPALRAGELVLAVGHPLGLRNVVTIGIIAAAGGRPWPGRSGIKDAVQAQIRLLPGNSGGPLIDASGRVVGVNAMVVGGDLALAIPSRTVARFVDGQTGAYLGIATQPVVMQGSRAAATVGALVVVDVRPGSPAEEAGLQTGDLLLEAAGQPLATASALVGVLDERAPEQTIDLRIVRGGRAVPISVQLGRRPD